MKQLWLAWWLVACGGGAQQMDPAARAREAERKRIEAMEPASPYEVRSIRGYRAPTVCGQGPYRIETQALGAHFGEQLEVNLCAPRSLEGDFRFTRGSERGEAEHFGSHNNSDYCVASAADHARVQTTGDRGGSAASGGGSAGVAPAAPAASAAPIALVPLDDTPPETCPQGTYLTGILHFTSTSYGDDAPWKADMPLVLELWSATPLHLDGAVFVVIQRGVHSGMTVDGWTSYREARNRYIDTWNAYLSGEVTAGRTKYLDTTAHTQAEPPPPRAETPPPKPSEHAEWIVGYWQREGDWIWSPGFWRVPQADIDAERTVEAPAAPPPVKVEAVPPPAPAPAAASASVSVSVSVSASATAPTPAVKSTTTLVWTPGYWAWNGSAWLWIEGAWRIPPQPGARWVEPVWTPRRGRVVLHPGGWTIKIGR